METQRIIDNKNKSLKDIFFELLNSFEIIFFLVKRDFVIMYKQTVLGPAWYLLQPLITSFVFLIIFNKFAKIPTDGIPPILFYLIANICWIFFSSSFSSVSLTLINNADIYKKVYFCRLAPPIANIIFGFIKFLFQFILVLFVYVWYLFSGFEPQITISCIFLPLFILHLSIIIFSLGIFICSFAIKYRDLLMITNFGIQMLMFATPVIYSFGSIPEKYKFFGYINPLIPIFENIRNSLFGLPLIDFNYYLSSIFVTFILLFLALKIFLRFEKNFVDTI
tara:strand:- start:24306 stop:25142 length:837 start_codon:yes stop_codon:yes gene_type:complete